MKLALLLLLCLLTFIPVTQAQDSTPSRAVVCHHTAMNIRAEARVDSTSLGLIAPGTSMTVLEKDRRDYAGMPWSYVRIDGTNQEGWMFSPYLAYLPMTVTVAADELNVRAEPWTHAEKIAAFGKGNRLEVLGRERIYGNGGIWLYVRNFDTRVAGWVKTVSAFWNEDDNFVQLNEVCAGLLPVMAEASAATSIPATVWGNRPLQLHADDTHDAPIVAEIPNVPVSTGKTWQP